MIRFLFPSLTRDDGRARGGPLFDLAVREARRTDWFTGAGVPDTLDGRFSVLATVIALIMVRLEHGSGESASASVGLTERFVEVMDSEHRQLGLGDPTLGKKVRKLVGALERRVDLWRITTVEQHDWPAAVDSSLYRDLPDATKPQRALAVRESQTLWQRLESTAEPVLLAGKLA